MSFTLVPHSSPARRTLPAVALLSTLIFAAGCSGKSEAGSEKKAGTAVPARFFTVEEHIVKRRVQATGSLFPIDESAISSQVEGRVDKILVDVGDNVRQGQILVEISPTELQFDLDRQRAAVAQVRARLGIGPGEPVPTDPNTVATVQRAAADLFDAEGKHRRAEQLFREQLISKEQLDEAGSRFKSARAALDLAVQEVDHLKAQLLSSEADRRLAEKKLADATIRAPFPGAIQARRINPGEFLRLQSPVMVLVRTDTLRARLSVPERWAGAVRTGSTVDLQVEAFPGETFQGRLERINPSVAADTRTFEIEALVPNAAGRLKPGFFVQASLPSEVEEKTIALPEQAVSYLYGVYKVFLVEGDKVVEREIKPGVQTAGRIEILEGLRAGQRVAVAVEGRLASGATVREQASSGAPTGK